MNGVLPPVHATSCNSCCSLPVSKLGRRERTMRKWIRELLAALSLSALVVSATPAIAKDHGKGHGHHDKRHGGKHAKKHDRGGDRHWNRDRGHRGKDRHYAHDH